MQHRIGPRIIDAPGQYLTRGGERVTIERMTHWGNRGHGAYLNGTLEWWHATGRLLPFTLSQNDIVAKSCPGSM